MASLKEKAESIGPEFRILHPILTGAFGLLSTALLTLMLNNVNDIKTDVKSVRSEITDIRKDVNFLDKRVSIAEVYLRGERMGRKEISHE